jgi:hypothetical protein
VVKISPALRLSYTGQTRLQHPLLPQVVRLAGCADCSGGLAAERMIIMSSWLEPTGAIAGRAAAVARARPLPRSCTTAAASVAAIPVPAATSLGQDWYFGRAESSITIKVA